MSQAESEISGMELIMLYDQLRNAKNGLTEDRPRSRDEALATLKRAEALPILDLPQDHQKALLRLKHRLSVRMPDNRDLKFTDEQRGLLDGLELSHLADDRTQ